MQCSLDKEHDPPHVNKDYATEPVEWVDGELPWRKNWRWRLAAAAAAAGAIGFLSYVLGA